MFGRAWERGQATIVERKPLSAGPHGITTRWSYVGDVRLDSGEPAFRSTFDDPHLNGALISPTKGAVVGIKFQRKTRKVKLDRSDPSLNSRAQDKRRRAEAAARFDSAAAGSPPVDDR